MKLYGTQILLQVTLHVCYSAFITEYLYLGIYNLDHQFMGEETGHRVTFSKRTLSYSGFPVCALLQVLWKKGSGTYLP